MSWEEVLLTKGPSYAIFVYLIVLGVKNLWVFWQTKVYTVGVEREARDDADKKKREDRLFEIIEHNAQAWTEMRVTLAALQKSLDNQGFILERTASAIDKKAVLYEIIQDLLARPENQRKIDTIIKDVEASGMPELTTSAKRPARGLRPVDRR
jgi:hypothetical protein